jgi:hypothetical protein
VASEEARDSWPTSAWSWVETPQPCAGPLPTMRTVSASRAEVREVGSSRGERTWRDRESHQRYQSFITGRSRS